MFDKSRTRLLLLSVLVGVTMLAASILLRTLWRDEYWALYFSGVDLPLRDAIERRMTRDVHPPLYFMVEHFWRAPFPRSDIWARLFNLVALAAGAGVVWRLGRRRAQETALFLALCATSYWVIYFGAEVRMYALVFAACAVSVFAMRAALEAPSVSGLSSALFIFWIAGAIASASHYFGALWTACAGLCLGLGFLFQSRDAPRLLPQKSAAFVATGLVSIAALAPTLLWILHASPQTKPGAVTVSQTMGQAFSYASVQFGRGLFVKTFGSNIAAFGAAFLAAPMLARQKNAADAGVLGAIVLTVLIAFGVHVFALPALIKERAFIVVMPGVLYLCAHALGAIAPEQKRARALANLVPIFALISPFLFVPEYFKNREQLNVVRKLVREAGDCAGAPVLVYFRPSEQAQDFHPFMIATALRGATKGGGDLVLLDAATTRAPPWRPECRLRAMALVLGKGETALHATARARLVTAGATLDQWQEKRLGKGRSLVWLAPSVETSSPPTERPRN